MSNYEKQIRETAEFYDREMRAVESQGGEILSWFPAADCIKKSTTR